MKRRLFLIALSSALPLAPAGPSRRIVRLSGTVEAVHSMVVQVPRVEGQGGDLTLTKLIANGAIVREGDVIAEFDRTNQLTLARDARAKYDDLSHQVEQKQAEDRNNAEKRASDLQQAQADLAKARIDIRKGPILSDIEQQKNQIKLEDATAHVASLEKSNHSHEQAEAAELRILELQRDRQKVAVERAQNNAEKLSLRSPIAGMVALQNVWRNNSMGHAQEGDQLWPGSPLLRLFDPSAMQVMASVGEPEGALLVPGVKATVRLDAFPQLRLTARFDSASPVASAALGSTVKTFTARFLLDQTDPRLLPDLSAALDIEVSR
ncbi:MAG: efflux RND transporter periplasmic adaptor subunit [Acidobacteriaceae bacterium]|nr:efflux RND transporter periplasmic adaptor subunit [Acidobacteriaceae bacterium]MBV9764902.1 efflux RND transporter periplasmic adaptor subunit [Acidobacteriaceae bacterium]